MGRVRRFTSIALVATLALGLGAAAADEEPGVPLPLEPTPSPTPSPTTRPPSEAPEPETPPAEEEPPPPTPAGSAPTQTPPASGTEAAVRATSGLGMYVWRWDRSGSPAEVVRRAREVGLNFLVVRASSQSQGFYLAPVLAELLPLAHAAGIKVVAYDPPRFEDVEGDARRAVELASFRVGGHGIDALAADIEPAWELATPENADRYGRLLREALGPDYPMVAIVYPPNHVGDRFPFEAVARHFDVLSPMSYWRARTLDGAGYMAASVAGLERYGRPVTAIGQAFSYDDHRNPALRGYPTSEELGSAVVAAREAGAVGMSFWVWEHAEPWTFDLLAQMGWTGDPGPGIGVEPPHVSRPAPVAAAADVPPAPSPVTVTGRTTASAVRPFRAPLEPPRDRSRTLALTAFLVASAVLVLGRREAWVAGTGLGARVLVAAERGTAPLRARTTVRRRSGRSDPA